MAADKIPDATTAAAEQTGPPSAPQRRRAVIVSGIGLVLAGAGAWFVGRRLVDTWDETRDAVASAHLGWIAASIVLAAAGMLAIAVPWRLVLATFAVRRPVGQLVSVYFVGEIGKYLPGGVWPVVGRGELLARTGVTRGVAYGSVMLSLGVLYLAGLAVAGLFVPLTLRDGTSTAVWLVALVPVGLVCLHPVVAGRVLALVERMTRRRVGVEIPRWSTMLLQVAAYTPCWLLIGSATWALSRSLGASAGWSVVCGATVLSWAAGFIVAPVPGGVGVREAVFVASVTGMGDGTAAAVAIAARCLFVVVDAAGAGLGALDLARRRVGQQPASPSEPTADDASSETELSP